MDFADHLRRRSRQYSVLALWAGIFASYLLCLGLFYHLPAPDSHAAFSNLALNWRIKDYWKALNVSTIEFEYGRTGFVANWLIIAAPGLIRLLLIPAALLCILFRKFKPLLICAMVLHLSFEASALIETRGLKSTLAGPINTKALAQGRADAFGPTPIIDADHPAKSLRLCQWPLDTTSYIAEYEIKRAGCKPEWSQNLLHTTLMQRAYLADNPVEAKQHLDAMHPRDMEDATFMMKWRLMVMREWMSAKGYAPAKDAYDPQVMPGKVCRIISIICLATGSALAVIAALLIYLAIILRRRARRILTMDGELAPKDV